MTIKKIIISFLSISLLCSLLTANASINNSKDEVLKKQGAGIKYEKIYNVVEDFYAGAYYDEDNKFHVNITQEFDDMGKISEIYDVKFHIVKYSLSELEIFKNRIKDMHKEEESIIAIGISQKNNQVNIYIKEDLDEEIIKKIQKYIDASAIQYIKGEFDLEFN